MLVLAIWILSFVAGMVVILVLPPDYFVRKRPAALDPRPIVRLVLLIARNLLGGLLLVVGLVMALPLVPGPGLVFVLIGMGLVDFPGKRALELRLLRQRRLLRSVNAIRARFGRQALQTTESHRQSVVDSNP